MSDNKTKWPESLLRPQEPRKSFQTQLAEAEAERRERKNDPEGFARRLQEQQDHYVSQGLNLLGGVCKNAALPTPSFPPGRPLRRVELNVAAQERGLSRSQMLRLITTKRITGEKIRGRWYVLE